MISVIIPTFNTALLIERTLRSVLNQSLQNFEIIIVDDASTDNTLEVVENLRDSRICIFRQQQNQGPAAARNRGLREARGEYCAFLDGDDYWEPDFLKETANFLTAHPEAIAVSVMQCHKIIGKKPAVVPQNTGITQPVVLEDFFSFWAKFNHVCTGSVLMRTAIAKLAGGQREDLRVCEDLEFWALLATYGKWGFIPEILFTSDGGAATKKIGVRKKNHTRMKHIKNITTWGIRIFPKLSNKQKELIIPILNRITIPGTYSLLYIGEYKKAYQNIAYYFHSGETPVIVKFSKFGLPVWCLFAFAYRCYRFFKDLYFKV